MKTLGSLVPGLVLLFSVTHALPAEDLNPASGIRIRIANASSIPYSEVTVRFPSQEEKYGPLAPGASTEYRDVVTAYRYASATAVANGQPFRAMAIDYLGEEILEPGLYTYTLNINGGALSFGLLIDGE